MALRVTLLSSLGTKTLLRFLLWALCWLTLGLWTSYPSSPNKNHALSCSCCGIAGSTSWSRDPRRSSPKQAMPPSPLLTLCWRPGGPVVAEDEPATKSHRQGRGGLCPGRGGSWCPGKGSVCAHFEGGAFGFSRLSQDPVGTLWPADGVKAKQGIKMGKILHWDFSSRTRSIQRENSIWGTITSVFQNNDLNLSRERALFPRQWCSCTE